MMIERRGETATPEGNRFGGLDGIFTLNTSDRNGGGAWRESWPITK